MNGEAPDGPFFLRMPLACGRAAAQPPPTPPPTPAPPGRAHQGVGLAAPFPGPGAAEGQAAATASLVLPLSVGTCALPRATAGKRGNRGWAGCRWCEPRTGWQRQRAPRTLSSRGGPGAGAGGCHGPCEAACLLPTIPSSTVRHQTVTLPTCGGGGWALPTCGGGGLGPAHLCGRWPPPHPAQLHSQVLTRPASGLGGQGDSRASGMGCWAALFGAAAPGTPGRGGR